MSDHITAQIGPKPTVLTVGNPKAHHIVATVLAEGAITWREERDQDYNESTTWTIRAHEVVDENWKHHPAAAPTVFELRDGDRALETYAFPATSDDVSPETEDQIGVNWDRVTEFSGQHRLDLDSIHERILEAHLEQELAPRRPVARKLNVPLVPGISRQLSA